MKKLILLLSLLLFALSSSNSQIWSPLGTSMNNYVNALAAYNNELIAGGYFTTAGGIPANRIAKWSEVVNIKSGSNELPAAYKLSQKLSQSFQSSYNNKI